MLGSGTTEGMHSKPPCLYLRKEEIRKLIYALLHANKEANFAIDQRVDLLGRHSLHFFDPHRSQCRAGDVEHCHCTRLPNKETINTYGGLEGKTLK